MTDSSGSHLIANTGAASRDDRFGLYPQIDFSICMGDAAVSATPQVRWLFSNEWIAAPRPDKPLSGVDASMHADADIAAWHDATPLGGAAEYPPLVWIAAPQVLEEARLQNDTLLVKQEDSPAHAAQRLPFTLVDRGPLNQSWFDASSARFLAERDLRIRGEMDGGHFVAHSLWPADFRLPPASELAPLPEADGSAVRERVRALPDGGARAPFSVETWWQREGAQPPGPGTPVLGLILNGAQGDDDEAHGGHFAVITGRLGADGGMHDWLVNNFYTLDAQSEKGIIAAPVPLENYLADLNAGQAWYRPSCMLLATLHDERTAMYVQAALNRRFRQFYLRPFRYQHARMNCAGISLDTLRALDWRIPGIGAESWLRACAALPLVAIATGSLARGKASFDYLSEEQTRLYPAVAFEEVGADLLRLARGETGRKLSRFEQTLAEDIDGLHFVRVPQFPSSRAWGSHAIANSGEYRARVPRDLRQRKIIPLPPRQFPPQLIDAAAPEEPPLHSDHALRIMAVLALAALLVLAL
ncbi:MAG: hypothetical protein L6Q60_14090 [Rhodocyclaceae bacterium]|nr:hypothetical protein [Rhodocyclaceae bacterium]